MEQPHGPSALPPPRGSSPARVIVDSKYCALYPVHLNIVRKLMCITSGNFVITDVNGNLLFKVKNPFFSLHEKRILLDASGTPLLTMKEKMVSSDEDDTWQIFRGESKDPSKLLFTVKQSSMTKLKTKLHVFLAQNKEENKCDFKVKGSRVDRSFVVYAGESDTIVAQMQKKQTALSVLFGQDNFSVTVSPNFDYAFIVALIVIIHHFNYREDIDMSGGPIGSGSC